MSKPILTPEMAATKIRSVLTAFGCRATVSAADVSVTENVVMLGFKGERLANEVFDFVSPKAKPGIYYHYTPFETFQAIVSSRSLQFYSTKKKVL